MGPFITRKSAASSSAPCPEREHGLRARASILLLALGLALPAQALDASAAEGTPREGGQPASRAEARIARDGPWEKFADSRAAEGWLYRWTKR